MRETLKALTIRPTGAMDTGDLPENSIERLRAFYRVIGCDTVTVVTLSARMLMWLDDEGMVNGSPVNPYATRIAAACGWGGQPYFGTAVITGRSPGGETAGLAEKDIREIRGILASSGSTTTPPRETDINGEGQ